MSHIDRTPRRRLPRVPVALVATVVVATAIAVVSSVTTAPNARASTFDTVIAPSSFNSYSALESEWRYQYPWGSDHNGSARMYGSPTDHSQVSLSGGALTLKATRIASDEGASTSAPHLAIKYHSGAVSSRDQIVVNDKFPSYEIKGEFQAPAVRGAWPAFWLTGVTSWPPESDILEYKGDSRNWFNTFRTPGDVSTTTVSVASPGSWHEYRVWITKINATDIDIHYYIDGAWQSQHRATGYVGKPMWLIINLQMEGSSGSPGPSGDTLYKARNVYVGRTSA
jgi:galactan endo-beta-1,3-galactanase